MFSCVRPYWWQNRTIVWRGDYSVNIGCLVLTVDSEFEWEVEFEVEPDIEPEFEPKVESQLKSEVQSKVEPMKGPTWSHIGDDSEAWLGV